MVEIWEIRLTFTSNLDENQLAGESIGRKLNGIESFERLPHLIIEKRMGERIVQYGFSRIVKLSYEQAIDKVVKELKKEGFGVLTSIDVKDTLKKKIGVDFKKYVILGACNPTFAHQSLLEEEELGLLLPCNVIVYEQEGKTRVSIFDPMVMTNLVENPKIKAIAQQVKEVLQRVLAAVEYPLHTKEQ